MDMKVVMTNHKRSAALQNFRKSLIVRDSFVIALISFVIALTVLLAAPKP
jgi:hypothetical protein